MPIVRVTEAAVVQDPDVEGNMVALIPDTAWDSRHPIVRAFPKFFAADVEQATAAPGEKRSVVQK